MTKYFELSGEPLKKFKQMLKDRQAAIEQCWDLCKEVGAIRYGLSGGGMQERLSCFQFEGKPDEQLWKRTRHDDAWQPRLATKAGKELWKRMQAIKIPGGSTVASIIGMQCFKFPEWRTPGFYVLGRRYIVKVPDDVEPLGGKRISDVDFERLYRRHRGNDKTEDEDD